VDAVKGVVRECTYRFSNISFKYMAFTTVTPSSCTDMLVWNTELCHRTHPPLAILVAPVRLIDDYKSVSCGMNCVRLHSHIHTTRHFTENCLTTHSEPYGQRYTSRTLVFYQSQRRL
jgi:hypothetical protein